MPKDPLQVLRSVFGYERFRGQQRAVIDHLTAGGDALVLMPTGGGKSLCYQLPAVELDGLTLVISPLIALMKDQIDALRRRGIAAERLDSTLDGAEYRRVIDALRSGALRLLYVAPERFANERFRATIEKLKVALFAIDEAHCISEWGHNFRPDYLKLPVYARRCGAERLLALTATATPRVLDDICRGFKIAPDCAVRTGVYRPNLTLLATPTTPATRDAQLIERLRSRPPGPTIVYVTLQRTAEDVAARLRQAGFDAAHYHAGCDDDIRSRCKTPFSPPAAK
jgi:ATP-dependent DNA helicase RecQ